MDYTLRLLSHQIKIHETQKNKIETDLKLIIDENKTRIKTLDNEIDELEKSIGIIIEHNRIKNNLKHETKSKTRKTNA